MRRFRSQQLRILPECTVEEGAEAILNLAVADETRPARWYSAGNRCGVQALATSVRECSHLKHEISTNVTTCVLSILCVGEKIRVHAAKGEVGALLLCNRGPLGTRRGRWSYPQCITCILNLVCCVLQGGSAARPGSLLPFLPVR
jgi:hypothetical protein